MSLAICLLCFLFFFFFFNDTAPTEIYTLSLHDALPIGKRWLADGPKARRTGTDCRTGKRLCWGRTAVGSRRRWQKAARKACSRLGICIGGRRVRQPRESSRRRSSNGS